MALMPPHAGDKKGHQRKGNNHRASRINVDDHHDDINTS
jgi:hypothetical protein